MVVRNWMPHIVRNYWSKFAVVFRIGSSSVKLCSFQIIILPFTQVPLIKGSLD